MWSIGHSDYLIIFEEKVIKMYELQFNILNNRDVATFA